jgi:hypothetical protein
MILVNETHQDVSYWINCDAVGPNCGDIPVDGIVKLPEYDNQTNVMVSFKPGNNAPQFSIEVKPDGHQGEQVEMALVVEPLTESE